MKKFSEWLEIKESSETFVSGPGISMMQATMRDMAGRGVPKEYNDYGFGKSDYRVYEELYSSGHITSQSIPVSAARVMLRVLSRYQNTQVRNYREISSLVQKDIRAMLPRSSEGSPESDDKVVVFDKQQRSYGKIRVYVPHGLDRSTTILINRVLDASLAGEGRPKVPNSYSGKMEYPRYLKMSVDKSSVNSYWVHPSVLGQVEEVLKSKGLEVEYESGSSGLSAGDKEPAINTQAQPDVIVLGAERNEYGNKVAVTFNYEKSRGMFQRMKDIGLSPKGIAYAGEKKFLINTDDRQLFDRVVAAIKEFGLDVSPLEEFMKSLGAEGDVKDTGSGVAKKEGVIRFSDAEGDSITIKTDVRGLSQDRKDFVRESIQYTFPDYAYDSKGYFYKVAGNFKQYAAFGRTLARFGYPVDELRAIVRKKLDSGRLKLTEWEGKYDKDRAFQDSIEEKVPDSMIDLYDEQKFGVAFLYGRDSAILGDATGVGKTAQLITAAALRMQANGKPTLIITLNATQKQFASEILRVVGEGDKGEISLDPMNPKKWTVVKYSDFSGGKEARNDKVRQHVASLKDAGFGVVILDELHKVKHGTSQRSVNIAEVVNSIPTRWGASATVSSNKPMDVKNQLLMMGHPLGRVKEAKFKKEFAGMVAGGYGGSLKKSDNQDDEIRAAERLNKWLNLSGVYVRREKDDIRKMPELSVESEGADIDRNSFTSMYNAKLSGYKNPDLAVSKLIAAREVVAQIKTDETARMVLQTVRDGEGKPPAASKIVVFTNFIESGRKLVEKISAGLSSINPDYTVLTYLSDTAKKEREQVKRKFTDDPNAKVLVMSMRMGGTGIDFPNAAQHMIINDFDWTPESAEQSEGRIYRINTDHPVKIRYIVGEGLDRDLFEMVRRKREIAAIIQKYRREYHDSEDAPEALKKIVDAQKELRKLDDDMAKAVAANLPGAEGAMKESFSSYLSRLSEISEYMFASD